MKTDTCVLTNQLISELKIKMAAKPRGPRDPEITNPSYSYSTAVSDAVLAASCVYGNLAIVWNDN